MPAATISRTTTGVTGQGTAVTMNSGLARSRHSATDPKTGTASFRGLRVTAPTQLADGTPAATRQ